MKALLFFCFFLICSQQSFAQSNTTEVANLATWARLLDLDRTQNKQLNTIESQRSIQLRELATVKNSNPALYNNKLQAINANTLAKLRNLLRPEQLNLYQQEMEKREKQKIAQAQQMRINGATKSEIDNFLNN